MSEKSKLFFNGKKKVIGMVHLLPLPGNAAYQNNKGRDREERHRGCPHPHRLRR